MRRPTFTPKLPVPFDDHHLHPMHQIPRPIPLTTPNGVRIQSAVLPQYTFRTDIHTQTDRWDKRQVYSNDAYALLYSQKVTHCVMHYGAKRGLEITCRLSFRLSVYLSVCDVGG